MLVRAGAESGSIDLVQETAGTVGWARDAHARDAHARDACARDAHASAAEPMGSSFSSTSRQAGAGQKWALFSPVLQEEELQSPSLSLAGMTVR